MSGDRSPRRQRIADEIPLVAAWATHPAECQLEHPTTPIGGVDDPRWHVPQIARLRDGQWGVFCAACSHHLGDYVNPCRAFLQAEWPATPLVEVGFDG